ncbi:MAG: hypothetical protein Q4G11_05940, partial [Gallicola sp.]|nr:hypothetical protein [Gallicola sp.]
MKLRVVIFSVLLAIALVLMPTGESLVSATAENVIEDPVLKKAINEFLSSGQIDREPDAPITVEDLEGMGEGGLNIPKEVETLKGLGYAV